MTSAPEAAASPTGTAPSDPVPSKAVPSEAVPAEAVPSNSARSDDGRPGDFDIGAFSENPPWLVVPSELTWRHGIGAMRRATAAEVPQLMRRRRVPPLRRMVLVGLALARALGGWYLLDRWRARWANRPEVSQAGLSHRLRLAFERLGPTYVKLGQILSSGQGIFPEPLVDEFKLLRDHVPAEPFETVRAIVEEDLGLPLDLVFKEFDTEPLAAASVAQVHAAVLLSGEPVVVKVQRPTVADLVRRDLSVMSWIAPALIGRIPVAALANPPALVQLFAETIVEELDFRLEADNMLDIAHILAETDQRALLVPRPHPSLVTRRVLVMERLDGFRWDDVAGMHGAGVDTSAVVHAGMIAFLEGAMLYGVFHGDLHGGNLFVRPDGKVVLLDFGITGRLDEGQRLAFLRLLMGGTVNDIKLQMTALRDLGALPPDTDLDAVMHDLGFDQPVKDPTTMEPDELIGQVRDLTKALLGYGARMPKELMLFVKDLLFLDGALATLAPDVDLFSEITSVATYFATRYGERIAHDVGIDPRQHAVDLDGVKASFGLTNDIDRLTYRELQARREIIRSRMEESRRRSGKRRRRNKARRAP